MKFYSFHLYEGTKYGFDRLLSLCDLPFKAVRNQAVESFRLFIHSNFSNSDIP